MVIHHVEINFKNITDNKLHRKSLTPSRKMMIWNFQTWNYPSLMVSRHRS